VYNAIAVICANIQALKVAPFFGAEEALALSTALFATTFVASDILTERKGPESATRGLALSFIAQIVFTLFMLLAVAYPTSHGNINGLGIEGELHNSVQYGMYTLFVPSARILTASLLSYYISQLLDIYLFQAIKKLTAHKLLWLRFNASTLISGLVDNAIFSTLAWVLLADQPVSLSMLIYTYILGSYAFRAMVGILATPAMYYAQRQR
jgi:uncharacterized integral membrane protein (TIGR00697 family)